MNGYIKISYDILDWQWFGDSNTVHLLLYLILKARWKDGAWQGHELKRGQLLIGRRQLALDLGMTEQNVRTSLKHLILCGEITTKPTNKYSIVTVCKYDKYTSAESYPNQQTNQQLTSNQPTTNQQLTTNEERIERKKEIYKERKFNIKENETTSSKENANEETTPINPKRFIKPTPEEVDEYCKQMTEQGKDGYNFSGNQFVDYYESKGWLIGKTPMKDWKAACRTWANSRKQPRISFETDKKLPIGHVLKEGLNERIKQKGITSENFWKK